jgi:hypothetical protein
MRVSKVVREYIERRVREKYAPKLEVLGAEYKAREEEINKTIRKMVEDFDVELKRVVAEMGGEYQFKPSYSSHIIDCCREVHDNDEWNKIREEERKIRKEMQSKIDNIVVELELGGNKETLERLLAEL